MWSQIIALHSQEKRHYFARKQHYFCRQEKIALSLEELSESERDEFVSLHVFIR